MIPESATSVAGTVKPSSVTPGPVAGCLDLAALGLRVAAHRAKIYEAGEALDEQGQGVPIWPAGLIQPAADALRDLVVRERAVRTLEVGLGLGLSSMAIVEGLCRLGEPTSGHLTIDPGQGWCDRAGIRALRESGAEQITTIREQDSALVLPELAATCLGTAEGGRGLGGVSGPVGVSAFFDFAFIDGAHLFDRVLVDLFFAMRVVKPGGLIVMDDHWMPSVQTVLAFAVTNWAVKLELFDPEGPAKRLVAFRNDGGHATRGWDHFHAFSRKDLPKYPWRE